MRRRQKWHGFAPERTFVVRIVCGITILKIFCVCGCFLSVVFELIHSFKEMIKKWLQNAKESLVMPSWLDSETKSYDMSWLNCHIGYTTYMPLKWAWSSRAPSLASSYTCSISSIRSTTVMVSEILNGWACHQQHHRTSGSLNGEMQQNNNTPSPHAFESNTKPPGASQNVHCAQCISTLGNL